MPRLRKSEFFTQNGVQPLLHAQVGCDTGLSRMSMSVPQEVLTFTRLIVPAACISLVLERLQEFMQMWCMSMSCCDNSCPISCYALYCSHLHSFSSV